MSAFLITALDSRESPHQTVGAEALHTDFVRPFADLIDSDWRPHLGGSVSELNQLTDPAGNDVEGVQSPDASTTTKSVATCRYFHYHKVLLVFVPREHANCISSTDTMFSRLKEIYFCVNLTKHSFDAADSGRYRFFFLNLE